MRSSTSRSRMGRFVVLTESTFLFVAASCPHPRHLAPPPLAALPLRRRPAEDLASHCRHRRRQAPEGAALLPVPASRRRAHLPRPTPGEPQSRDSNVGWRHGVGAKVRCDPASAPPRPPHRSGAHPRHQHLRVEPGGCQKRGTVGHRRHWKRWNEVGGCACSTPLHSGHATESKRSQHGNDFFSTMVTRGVRRWGGGREPPPNAGTRARHPPAMLWNTSTHSITGPAP